MRLNRELPTVLFPIEIATRELDSKLMMASALAAVGCRSVVGHKEQLKAIARRSRRVIWQGKSLFSSKTSDHVADDLIANGSSIMFLHDEGGIHQVSVWTENVLKKHRVDDLRKRDITRVCVWGDRQREVISEFAGELSDALTVTGSPRFDLCHPKFSWLTSAQDRSALTKYKPYILVCTRFVNAAHAEGQDAPFVRRMRTEVWPKSFDVRKVADVFFSQWQQAVHDFADLVMFVKELALSHPERTVILRPHPSESMVFYQQAFYQFKNVEVRRDQSVLDWIREADLVVHSNCTTGIEAVLAGRPVLNLLPANSARIGLDLEVAREAGCIATSVEDALDKAGQFLAGKLAPYSWSSHAQSILHNLKADSIPVMVKETLDVIRERGLSSSEVSVPTHGHLRSRIKRLLGRSSSNAYVASKRGSIDVDRVEAVVGGCKTANIGTGSIEHVTDGFVVIQP